LIQRKDAPWVRAMLWLRMFPFPDSPVQLSGCSSRASGFCFMIVLVIDRGQIVRG
jgi:hypothetical protein